MASIDQVIQKQNKNFGLTSIKAKQKADKNELGIKILRSEKK